MGRLAVRRMVLDIVGPMNWCALGEERSEIGISIVVAWFLTKEEDE